MARTAAADSRIVTLAKRAKASSMNMPKKACESARTPQPMATAAASRAITDSHSTGPATRSLPKKAPNISATSAKIDSATSGMRV